MEINFIYEKFKNLINNCNGSVINNPLQISGNLFMNISIIELTGSNISPLTPSTNIKLTLTPWDRILKGNDGRISGLGIDNAHGRLHIHQLGCGSPTFLNELNLGSLGLFAFIDYYPKYFN